MNLSQLKIVLNEIVASQSKAKPKGRIIPILTSAPGLGKTSVVEQVADNLNIGCRTVVIAQFDPAELSGLPYLEGNTYVRAKPFFLNFTPEEVKRGGILFLDELAQATTAGLNVVAQMTQEHRVGEHKIPDSWIIVAAANRMKDKAGTTVMPSHLRDRLTYIDIDADLDAFLDYAVANEDFDPLLVGFLNAFPSSLSQPDPKADASPSPRSWVRANTIRKMDIPHSLQYQLLTGQLGEKITMDLIGFLRNADKLPPIKSILKDPEGAPLPSEPSMQYAIVAQLAGVLTEDNADAVMTYSDRFKGKEYQALVIRDATRRLVADPKSKFTDSKSVLRSIKPFTERILGEGALKDLLVG